MIRFLSDRPVLWLLFIINVAGTIYGYIWYGSQLIETPPQFLMFVPDSPTASLFFCFVIGSYLLGKQWPIMEALAVVSLFKYGVWAVVLNALLFIQDGALNPIGLMLMVSHGAMAIEGVLFAPFYRFKLWHLAVAAIVVLHNDIIDYVFNMMPWYHDLNQYYAEIGYFTFWLSVLSIFIGYYVGIRKSRLTLSMSRN
ncbi:DUF1405 domain-containing protein [Bacillus sp. HMF5848]|nr:DUF1405 domain-containing protein [Bacillus sp. HMF5848]